MTLPQGLLLVVLGTVLVAALCDLRRYLIPDSLTLVLLAAALGRGVTTPDFDWVSHVAAPVAVLLVGTLLFSRGWFGGGDVKLLIGLAAWTGLGSFTPTGPLPLTGLPLLLALIAFAGGGLAGLLLIGRRLAAGIDRDQLPPMLHHRGPVPYAVAIAVGTFWWAQLTGQLA